MKKQVLFLAAAFTGMVTFAQTKPAAGLRAGASLSNIKGDAMHTLNSALDFTNGILSTRNRAGFFAGPYLNLPVAKNISIEPALYYAQKGTSLQGDLTVKAVSFLDASAQAQLKAHYIDLPLVAKVSFGGFQVFAGPQVSYLAKADLKTTAGVLGMNLLHKNFDVTNQFNRWDAGITGGIGYQFANGLNLSAAFDRGLSKVDAGKSLKSNNQSIKLGLGFQF